MDEESQSLITNNAPRSNEKSKSSMLTSIKKKVGKIVRSMSPPPGERDNCEEVDDTIGQYDPSMANEARNDRVHWLKRSISAGMLKDTREIFLRLWKYLTPAEHEDFAKLVNAKISVTDHSSLHTSM